MKVFVVGGANHYASIFRAVELVYTLEEADLVFFTGGADVDPILYGELTNPRTSFVSSRDLREIEVFNEALLLKKPMLGVCRGSQFLTVMSQGSLIQHVNNHAFSGTHSIKTIDGDLDITSTHHQMMYPYDLPVQDYLVVGWCVEDRSTIKLNGEDKPHKMLKEEHREPEIVRYHKTNCLCIQGHPEMQLNDKLFIEKINGIINKYLLKWDD